MVIHSGPLRVTRLDSEGQPTGETVEVDAFDISFSKSPRDDQELLAVNDLREITFTMDLCLAPGSRRAFVEAIADVETWKRLERIRKRYAHRARKGRRRQR